MTARSTNTARFTTHQALEQVFANVQGDYYSDSEDEVEDVSEEEDVDECNPDKGDDDEDDEEEGDEGDDDEEEEGEEEEGVGEEEEEDGEEEEEYMHQAQRHRQTFLSKNGTIKWSSVACHKQCGAADIRNTVIEMTPGPTGHALSQAHDIASTFHLFITPAIEKIILEMTNLEGLRKYLDKWKGMDETELRAYIGLLILAGVYRSRGEAAASLWDAESGRAIFRATMSLKHFHKYSRLLRFDDRDLRPARRATDKPAAIRDVWDAWVQRLPYLYNPGPHVTVDEQLVPFRGALSHSVTHPPLAHSLAHSLISVTKVIYEPAFL